MKTAISLPDETFREVEQYAKRTHKSRSQVFCEAVSEYLARHSADAVTEAIDAMLDTIGETKNDFVTKAGTSRLKQSEW